MKVQLAVALIASMTAAASADPATTTELPKPAPRVRAAFGMLLQERTTDP